MQIYKQTPSFGANLNTIKVLEATTLKNIEAESISDLKPIIDTLWPVKLKGTGNRGYRYYLSEIGNKIIDKYPEIAEASGAILEFSRKNPKAKRFELQEFVKPIVEKLGETIDITI